MNVLFDPESVFSLAALESKLVAYVKDPAAAQQPFDVASVPKISRAQAAQEAARKLLAFSVLTQQRLKSLIVRSKYVGYNRRPSIQESGRRPSGPFSGRETIRIPSTTCRGS